MEGTFILAKFHADIRFLKAVIFTLTSLFYSYAIALMCNIFLIALKQSLAIILVL